MRTTARLGHAGHEFDERERGRVRWPFQEIFARKAFRVIERERKLTRDHQPGFSPL